MPLNYTQIQSQVQAFAAQAPQREAALQTLRDRARQVFHQAEAEALRARLDAALTVEPHLRCARPADEPLTARFSRPASPSPVLVLAADGSQVNPDRHAPVLFYVINIGLIRLGFGLDEPPEERIVSQLAYGEQVLTRQGMVGEGQVALRRDLQERTLLAEAALEARRRLGADVPLITLTDGPLELWQTREGEGESHFDRALQTYLDGLRTLQQAQAATAGYVDRPRADLVVRLLELSLLPDLAQAGRERPLFGVTDADLFRDLLQPGERSAVFALQSRSAVRYTGNLALHFFYLNVGRAERPNLARVEVPAWVARTPALLDALHAVLLEQCAMLGTDYPYALHRAHETALVSHQEKARLVEWILLALRRQGLQPPWRPSAKQETKSLGWRRT